MRCKSQFDINNFYPPFSHGHDSRREEIRRQRIESEQRRRDELRDGYRRLKDALPVSNQKSSKVSLLDRATTHIKYLEMTQQQLQTRLQQAENETTRLRQCVYFSAGYSDIQLTLL
jgi:Helix-loop-helix DNA-binding domain